MGPGYRWVVLSNTTLAMLMATLNMSSVMIALPAIFRGIHLDPLGPGNFNYLLWMLMGYMVVTAVLVVNLGRLGDRFGARPFATGGMLLAAGTFAAMMLLPVDFSYPPFALVIFANGVAFGLFAAPNTTSIMNSVPARDCGVASGMRGTFQNAGMPISIAIFFSLMIIGLASRVPHTMLAGLTANGVPTVTATRLAHLPPVGYLFAAFLGSNPLHSLLGSKVLAALTPAQQVRLTGRSFFPSLISDPFKHGLTIILTFSIAMCLLAAWASWLRGAKYIHHEPEPVGGSAGRHGQ